jgi:hypothetical protein
MNLQENERIVCPAIWVNDGKKYENQPENIDSGYVVFGIHLVDIFYRMNRRGIGQPISCGNAKINEIHEGYYTNLKRFIRSWIEY